MAYKAQLVIRSNDPNDAEVLDKIRALSDERGQTLSEVALDVLRQGLMPGRTWEAPSPPAGGVTEPAPQPSVSGLAPQQAASEPVSPAPVSPAPVSPAPVSPAPVSPAPGQATIDPILEKAAPPVAPPVAKLPSPGKAAKPQIVVREFLNHRDNEDQDGARRVLIDFFALAGPAEVHALKQALKKVLKADDFLAVMNPLKETEVYQDYKKRVLLSL